MASPLLPRRSLIVLACPCPPSRTFLSRLSGCSHYTLTALLALSCSLSSTPPGISEPMQVAETFTFQLPDDISCPLDHDHSSHSRKQQPTHRSKGEAAEDAPAAKSTKKRRSSSGGSAKGDEGDTGAKGGSRRGSRRGSLAGEGAAAEGVGDSEGGLPPVLSSVARLDTCVTVVDAATFLDNLTSIEELADRCACVLCGGVVVLPYTPTHGASASALA